MYATTALSILLTSLFASYTLAIPGTESDQPHHLTPFTCDGCPGGNVAITVTNTTDNSGSNYCARGKTGGVTLTNNANAYGWQPCKGTGNGLITGVEPDFSSNDCTMHLQIAAHNGEHWPYSVMAVVEASLAAIGTVGPYATTPEGGGEMATYDGLDYGILIFATGWGTNDTWIFNTNGVNSTEMWPVYDDLWSPFYAHLEAKFDCATGVFAPQGP